jgi:hypothetical protein
VANYVLAFKGGSAPATEEEQQQVMAAWGAWYAALGEAVVDGGNPFGPSATIAPDGTVSDGGASALTGYTILAAGSLGEATEMSKGCPILASGGTVEVYETFDIM